MLLPLSIHCIVELDTDNKEMETIKDQKQVLSLNWLKGHYL